MSPCRRCGKRRSRGRRPVPTREPHAHRLNLPAAGRRAPSGRTRVRRCRTALHGMTQRTQSEQIVLKEAAEDALREGTEPPRNGCACPYLLLSGLGQAIRRCALESIWTSNGSTTPWTRQRRTAVGTKEDFKSCSLGTCLSHLNLQGRLSRRMRGLVPHCRRQGKRCRKGRPGEPCLRPY